MSKVQVYVYDLSHGQMAQMSQAFLGKHLPGLWHTSVVAYGREYFFGMGIQKGTPGMTSSGKLVEVLEYGLTEIPRELFEEHLSGLGSSFNAQTYHILENNCNSFTNEALSFLVGGELPGHIRSLPQEFLNTPMGAMMRPMIESFFRGNAPV